MCYMKDTGIGLIDWASVGFNHLGHKRSKASAGILNQPLPNNRKMICFKYYERGALFCFLRLWPGAERNQWTRSYPAVKDIHSKQPLN